MPFIHTLQLMAPRTQLRLLALLPSEVVGAPSSFVHDTQVSNLSYRPKREYVISRTPFRWLRIEPFLYFTGMLLNLSASCPPFFQLCPTRRARNSANKLKSLAYVFVNFVDPATAKVRQKGKSAGTHRAFAVTLESIIPSQNYPWRRIRSFKL